MDKGYNNTDLLAYAPYSPSETFFIQRWAEITNNRTHSKYAARYLNGHQLVKELLSVCRAIKNEEIKNGELHLTVLKEEARSLLEREIVLRDNAPTYLSVIRNAVQGSGKVSKPILSSMIYRFEYVNRHIEDNYLGWVIADLQDSLQDESENFDKINVLTQLLCSELLGEDWTLASLEQLVEFFTDTGDTRPRRRFEEFFNRITSPADTYVYMFKFQQGIRRETEEMFEKFTLDYLTGLQIKETYSEMGLETFVSNKSKYVRVINKCSDLQFGVNNAWQEVIKTLDMIKFYGYDVPDLEIAPIVIHPDGGYIRHKEISLVDNRSRFRAPTTMMDQIKDQMVEGDAEINKKIRSLFEFRRISEESLSPQSTYLNLWIGIEAFVQSEVAEGGLENVKTTISACSNHDYLFSLIKNFLHDCRRCMVQMTIEGEIYDFDSIRPEKVLKLFLNSSFKQQTERQLKEHNLLLWYRYNDLYSDLNEGRKAANLLIKHKANIQQHVLRLYRIRNSIVHSGVVEYPLNLFIKHLEEYMETIMKVVLRKLRDNTPMSLDEVFIQIVDAVDTTINILENSRGLDEQELQHIMTNPAF